MDISLADKKQRHKRRKERAGKQSLNSIESPIPSVPRPNTLGDHHPAPPAPASTWSVGSPWAIARSSKARGGTGMENSTADLRDVLTCLALPASSTSVVSRLLGSSSPLLPRASCQLVNCLLLPASWYLHAQAHVPRSAKSAGAPRPSTYSSGCHGRYLCCYAVRAVRYGTYR